MIAPIPVLIDAVEGALFPETRKRAALKLTHWDHCDFALHYRERAATAGTYRAARQLRKQGFGLHVALSVLARRPHV